MNDNDLGLALERLVAERKRVGPPPTLQQAVWAIPATTPPERRWLPRIDTRGFTMFSALKFVTAAVVVALFGGFLLAGILTTPQDGEVLPAAVTGSPEPAATTAPPEPSDPIVRTDILPSVALTVEEIEPGVFRVDNDGVRDLVYQRESTDIGLSLPDVVAGDDGGIWVLSRDVFYRLGARHVPLDYDVDGVLYWPEGHPLTVLDFEVAPEGTVWAAIETSYYPDEPPETGGHHLWSFDGEEWTVHRPTTPFNGPIEVAPEGTVWAVWLDDPGDEGSRVFGYLGAEGWTAVGEWFVNGDLLVSDSGDIWADGWESNIFGPHVHRFVDGAWQTYDEGPMASMWEFFDVGPDGTLWGHGGAGFVRFDGSDWMTFEEPEWMPSAIAGWRLDDDEWVPGAGDPDESSSLWGSSWGEPHVAPDGSLWVPARLGLWQEEQIVCDQGIDGVARFDGEAWSRHLQGHCVEAMDIAADGSVWLLASESGARYPSLRLYVITPED